MDEEGPKPVVEESKASLPLPEQKPPCPRVLDKLLRPFLRRGDAPETSNHEESLSSQYRTLRGNLKAIDRLIPKEGLEIWSNGTSGKRTAREKQFNANHGFRDIRTSIQDTFPDEKVQQQIISASNEFLQKIVSQIDTEKYDTVPLGQIDKFITEFPNKMFMELGEDITPDVVIRILRIGSRFIDRFAKKENEKDEYGFIGDERNFAIGGIAASIGENAPHLLGLAGNNVDNILNELEQKAEVLSLHELDKWMEYATKMTTPTTKECQQKIDSLREQLTKQYPTIEEGKLYAYDKEPWEYEAFMGKETRVPTWEDLAAVVLNMETVNRGIDAKEYGMRVIKNSEEGGNPLIEFIRGGEGAIKNKTGDIIRSENVFFHTHPAYMNLPISELNAPIVSPGDFVATYMSDYGGGFLNVASANGVTLHIGSTREEQSKFLPGTTYTVESGDLKSSLIDKDEKKVSVDAEDRRSAVKESLKNSSEKYIFSALKDGKRSYFIYVPWGKIGSSDDFYNICLGDGLPKLLEGISDMPDIPLAQNLSQALKQTKEIGLI